MASIGLVLRQLQVGTQIASEPLARALMLVYLVDWKAAIETGATITKADWVRVKWGPYSSEVVGALSKLRYGSRMLRKTAWDAGIDASHSKIIEEVRLKYSGFGTQDIAQLVLSTYPMIYSNQRDHLDLVKLADIYRRDFQKARDRAIA